MADEDPRIYRECVTLHYWGGLGNGVGLLAKVDFYDAQTCIRWMPQSRENHAVALTPETLERLVIAIREDRKRISNFLKPSLSDDDEHEEDHQ